MMQVLVDGEKKISPTYCTFFHSPLIIKRKSGRRVYIVAGLLRHLHRYILIPLSFLVKSESIMRNAIKLPSLGNGALTSYGL